MYLLKCLFQATKVRRHVFVKVPVPSPQSEMSCASSIDFTSFLDFRTDHTVWYFLFLILFQCSLLLFVCVLGFKKQ